jgi:hypothetical protein
MTRAAWLNAGLALAVAALATWVYYKPAGEAAGGHPLSQLRPDAVAAVHVERPGSPPISLEKSGGAWRLTAPFAARGDEPRVRRLLEILEARAEHRFPATDLARFELDQPRARLTVDRQAFSFGMVNPVTREQYVHTGDAVYAVSARYGTALPARAVEMADGRLFAPGETPVRIESKAFLVEQRDGKWMRGAGTAEASQDDFARWVDEWRLAHALRVEPLAAGKAQEEIRVGLKEGRTLLIGIVARAPELVLARFDEKVQFHFRPEVAKRLLSPPAAADEPPAKK